MVVDDGGGVRGEGGEEGGQAGGEEGGGHLTAREVQTSRPVPPTRWPDQKPHRHGGTGDSRTPAAVGAQQIRRPSQAKKEWEFLCFSFFNSHHTTASFFPPLSPPPPPQLPTPWPSPPSAPCARPAAPSCASTPSNRCVCVCVCVCVERTMICTPSSRPPFYACAELVPPLHPRSSKLLTRRSSSKRL